LSRTIGANEKVKRQHKSQGFERQTKNSVNAQQIESQPGISLLCLLGFLPFLFLFCFCANSMLLLMQTTRVKSGFGQCSLQRGHQRTLARAACLCDRISESPAKQPHCRCRYLPFSFSSDTHALSQWLLLRSESLFGKVERTHTDYIGSLQVAIVANVPNMGDE
jgi:hypothetical protein